MRLRNNIGASLLGLAFCLAGCRAEAPAQADVSVQPLGRYVETDASEYLMGWPGSGITFETNAQTVLVPIEDDGRGVMDVRVGSTDSVLDLEVGRNIYPISVSDDGTVQSVRITRRSEFYDTGTFTIAPPVAPETTDLSITKPAARDRQILFLGDSITAGFGVAGDTRDCPNKPTLHAPAQSYAMLAADGLNADYQLIAISGRGVVHNWDANPAPVMPAQIDFALPDNTASSWDHAQFAPDVVVTLLGTNDWSVIDPGQDKFRTGYRDMLAKLRERFDGAHIVTVSGPLLGGEKGAAIRDGIDWAMADIKDANISTLDLQLSSTGQKWSCNSHPGRTSMKVMATELMSHMEREVGWDDWTPPAPTLRIAPPEAMPAPGKVHFRRRLNEIAEQPKLDGGTLLVGDSITEAWLWHSDLLPGSVANHAVGWDVLSGGISRLPTSAADAPDRIFVMMGTNDISAGRTDAQIRADFDAYLTGLKAQHPKAQLIAQSILPRELSLAARINGLNTEYAKIAAKHGATFVDLTPIFAAPDGTLREDVTEDDLHLTEKGYALWADAIAPYF